MPQIIVTQCKAVKGSGVMRMRENMKEIALEEKEEGRRDGILPGAEISIGIGKEIPLGAEMIGIEMVEVIEMTETDVKMMMASEGGIVEILPPSTSNQMSQSYMAFMMEKSQIFWTLVAL